MMTTVSLCVYCGSRPGVAPAYTEAAQAVGLEIARRGWQLVYGGGRAGLMGTVADAALAGGARVVGVIPQSLMQRERGHGGLHELHVVDTMHQRKMMMAQRADAFLSLPGGIGTFEELFEMWSWRQLGYHDKPLGLLNVQGYYDRLLEFLTHARDQALMTSEQMDLLLVEHDVGSMLDRLGAQSRRPHATADYQRT